MNVVDPFGSEDNFKADVAAFPGLYPPPDATLVVPMSIEFYNNSKGVNVGHFNQMSMTMNKSSSIPLLDRIKMGMPIISMGMHIMNYSTSEVRIEPLAHSAVYSVSNILFHLHVLPKIHH